VNDTFISHQEADTDRLGRALARVLTPGSVVALNGTLGAGKTRLVQALAEALEIDRATVVSPTFVLVQEHVGRLPLFHFDAYRLRDDDEFLELGPEEYFSAGGITVIEWAERVVDCLPADRLEIQINVMQDESRQFLLSAFGTEYEQQLKSLMELLAADAKK
jgi:tRNA threonylcarbamoyladenosine biosynthesis protein TsaE